MNWLTPPSPGDFTTATLPPGIDDIRISTEGLQALDGIDCEPPFSFSSRRRFARDLSSLSRTDSVLWGESYVGEFESVTRTWREFLLDWWLTGLPAQPWDYSSSADWVGYRGHLIRRTGHFWMNDAMRREVMLMIDALRGMASFISGYEFETGPVATPTVYPIGEAFNEVMSERRICIGAWDTVEAVEAASGSDVSQEIIDLIESSDDNFVFAAYDLADVRAGVRYNARARSMILDKLRPPESADYAVLVDRSAWNRTRSGGQVDVDVPRWQSVLPYNCVARRGWTPDGRSEQRAGNVRWHFPRLRGDLARVLMQAPNRQTALLTLNGMGVSNGSVPLFEEVPLESWVEAFGGFTHEVFHHAFSHCGLTSSDEVCDGSNAIDAAVDGEWLGSRHFFCNLAGNEVAEAFAFGAPNGRLTDSVCTLRDRDNNTAFYEAKE